MSQATTSSTRRRRPTMSRPVTTPRTPARWAVWCCSACARNGETNGVAAACSLWLKEPPLELRRRFPRGASFLFFYPVPVVGIGNIFSPNQGLGQAVITRPSPEFLVQEERGGAAVPFERPEIGEIHLDEIGRSKQCGRIGIPIGIVEQNESA